jgi:hypothetical protein
LVLVDLLQLTVSTLFFQLLLLLEEVLVVMLHHRQALVVDLAGAELGLLALVVQEQLIKVSQEEAQVADSVLVVVELVSLDNQLGQQLELEPKVEMVFRQASLDQALQEEVEVVLVPQQVLILEAQEEQEAEAKVVTKM